MEKAIKEIIENNLLSLETQTGLLVNYIVKYGSDSDQKIVERLVEVRQELEKLREEG